MGIDPGSRITGYGFIEHKGNHIAHIDNGLIRPKTTLDLPERIHTIFIELKKFIDIYQPSIAVIEDVFVAKNAKSALILGHARGAAILAAREKQLPAHKYSPTAVKQAIVGHGRASKTQIQNMVRVLLSLPEVAYEDASDALAIAICHAHSSKMAALIS